MTMALAAPAMPVEDAMRVELLGSNVRRRALARYRIGSETRPTRHQGGEGAHHCAGLAEPVAAPRLASVQQQLIDSSRCADAVPEAPLLAAKSGMQCSAVQVQTKRLISISTKSQHAATTLLTCLHVVSRFSRGHYHFRTALTADLSCFSSCISPLRAPQIYLVNCHNHSQISLLQTRVGISRDQPIARSAFF